jgi:hypothetical protein
VIDRPPPWQRVEACDLPADPSAEELRRAARVLRMGGSIGGPGADRWVAAIAATISRDKRASTVVDVFAYKRVRKLLSANEPPPSGAIPKAVVR